MEHNKAKKYQIYRDWKPGLQLNVCQECQRIGLHTRLQPKSNQRLDLPIHEEDCDAHRPHLPRPIPGSEPRWPNTSNRRRRRDSAILECFSAKIIAAQSLDLHAEFQRPSLNLINGFSWLAWQSSTLRRSVSGSDQEKP